MKSLRNNSTCRIPPKVLSLALRTPSVGKGYVERLKAVYRPYICPFDDLLLYVNAQNAVFDIGCGQGQFALLLAEFAHPRALGGVEISTRLVQAARDLLRRYERHIPVDFEPYDGTNFPVSIARYDTVFLIDVVHHINPAMQQAFLNELYRAMSVGSRLIIKEIDRSSPLVVANKLHDLVFAGEVGHERSRKQLTEMVEASGFRVFDVKRRTMLWYPHFTLGCVKQSVV